MARFLLFPFVLAAAAVALLVAHSRGSRARLGVDLASLAAISLCLWLAGGTPLPALKQPAVGPPDIWLRGLAVGWWLFAGRLAASLVRLFLGHGRRSREMRLFSDLLAGCIHLAATLVVVDVVLRLPIGGLLATSGVVAIVFGLALQSTLADVFAGIAVGIEQPFHVGDRIRLNDVAEGTVAQINWRSIRLRTEGDDLVVVPNSTVAKAQVVNRSSPTDRGTVRIDITANATVDPDRVFALMHQATMLTPAVLTDPKPLPLLLRLGERTNGYALIVTVEDTGRSGRVRSDVLRHLRRQLATVGLLTGSDPDCGGRLLRETVLFEGLAPDTLTRLEASLGRRTLATGDVMFAQGSRDPVLYLVASGVFEISRAAEAGIETLGRIGAGEYIGEIGLLTGEPREVTATAITEAEVFTLGHEALDPLLAHDDRLAVAFEQSVRRGLALLKRSPAAAMAEDAGGAGELLVRIRRFFVRR